MPIVKVLQQDASNQYSKILTKNLLFHFPLTLDSFKAN